ncbi:MAG TPA: XRE family transcriptional regulator [Nitrospirae bacterium]|nr:XRE family transcriptional regulator [Nitrospirota bacterium]
MKFGKLIRQKRESLLQTDRSYSLRQVASRIGVQPSFLSKIERGEEVSVSEEKITALAKELGLEPDILLAMNGKVSKEIQNIIRKRPELFTQLIRELSNMPDNAILRIVREVRDGNW